MRSAKITKIISNAKASLQLEGLNPSNYSLLLAQKYLEGKISKEEATQLILTRYIK